MLLAHFAVSVSKRNLIAFINHRLTSFPLGIVVKRQAHNIGILSSTPHEACLEFYSPIYPLISLPHVHIHSVLQIRIFVGGLPKKMLSELKKPPMRRKYIFLSMAGLGLTKLWFSKKNRQYFGDNKFTVEKENISAIKNETIDSAPSPLDSIRDAVFTVSPKRQYRGIVWPTTPATTGPKEDRKPQS